MRHEPGRGASRGGRPAELFSERLVRRRALLSLLQSGLVTTVIVVAYFVLPLSSPLTTATALMLFLGCAFVIALLAWQIRAITRSPYPRIRAFTALVTTLPVFLVVFATTYFVMGRTQPDDFSETLSRLDAIYFTVTVFATVGFGDITPVTAGARSVVTVQMIGDVVLVGFVAHVILGAMREGLRRQGLEDRDRDHSA